MKHIYLVLILTFCFHVVIGQQDKITFFITQAQKAQQQGNTQVALQHYVKVAFLQENAKDGNGLLQTYVHIASIYQTNQVYQKSLDYYLKTYELHQKLHSNNHLMMTAAQQVGMAYLLLQDYPHASNYYQTGLTLAQELQDLRAAADIKAKLCLIAQQTNRLPTAIVYAQESLVNYELLKDTLAQASSLNNLGFLYREANDIGNATATFQKALLLNQAFVKSKNGEAKAVILQNIGVLYTNLNNAKLALEALEGALMIRKQMGKAHKVIETQNYIAKYYLVDEYYDKAEMKALEAANMAQAQQDYKNLADSYKILADIYRATGEYRKASAFDIRREAAKDSLAIQKEKMQRGFQSKQLDAERQESEYRFVLAEKQRQELVLQQLQLEADKKQKELELNQQKLASLEKDQRLKEAEVSRQVEEKRRIQQDLEISRQKLLAEHQQQQLITLQKEQALQALVLEQQKRKADEAALQQTKLEAAGKLAAQEREKEQQQQQFILYTAIGFVVSVLLILSAVIWSFLQKRKDNQKLEKQAKALKEANEEISASEEELKQNIEELAATQEQLQKQYGELEAKNKNISDSIHYARRIQLAMLPHHQDIKAAFPASFILYQPRDVISGDFYWFSKKDDLLIVVVADCTGHGVPGAFMSMLGCSLINQVVHDKEIHEPHQILDFMHVGVEEMLNQKMIDSENRDGMDAAIFTFNPRTHTLQFAGANNPIYIIHRNPLSLAASTTAQAVAISQDEWTLTEIKADKRPIGGRTFQTQEGINYTLHEFQCEQLAHIYLFSDGFIDQIGGKDRKKIMSKGLKNLLLTYHTLPFEEQHQQLTHFFEQWIQSTKRQLDDVLIWGVEINSESV